jgi:predicted phage terminase large subunit-like protein
VIDVPVSAIDAELKRRLNSGEPAAVDGLKDRPDVRMPFRHFLPAAWKNIDGRPFLPNWHLAAKCDLLEQVSDGKIDRLIINEPPGLAKSKVASVCWPAWEWGPANHPATRWLCISYGGGDEAPATRDGQQMRLLINTPWYQQAWGSAFQLQDDQNAKAFYRNDQHGYRVSVGLDGGIPGTRADRILIDDPSKPEDVWNPATLKKPIDLWESTIRHRIVDEGSSVVLVMHRIHEDDLTGYFLKQDGWVHLRLPHFYEEKRRCQIYLHDRLIFSDPRTEEGEPLHKGMTLAARDARNQLDTQPQIGAGQQQQHPVPLEGTTIKAQWIRRWTALPDSWDDYIITVDCAFKAAEHNSYVVMQAWALRFTTAYLLDQEREHLDLPDTADGLLAFCARHPDARGKYVEAKANGVGVVQMLKNKIPGLMTTDDDEEVLKKFCTGSKEAKLAAVADYYKAGNILIPTDDAINGRGKKWVPEHIYELTTFPMASGGYDDQVDAASMAVWKLLHTIDLHVSAAMVMGEDAGNVGLVAGVFETAYGAGEGTGGLEHGAFGGSTGLGETIRGAFG